MSCRTTSAGSAFTTYARLANNNTLSDVATLSTFHYLRHLHSNRNPETRRVYTEEEYRALLNRQIERTRNLHNISDARRESILARLNQALTDPMPDQSTCYALFNLNPTVRDRGRGIRRFLLNMREESGRTLSEANLQAQYEEYENEIDRSRGAADPATYTEANIEFCRSNDMPTDPGTVNAVARMRGYAERARIDHYLTQPQRIIHDDFNSVNTFAGQELALMNAGYDPRNGRLEVSIQDENGISHDYAYHDVPAEVWSNMISERNGTTAGAVTEWFTNVRSNPAYAYNSDLEAAVGSVAPRCNVCGQFANTSHACPQIAEPRRIYDGNTRSRWSRATASAINPETGVSTDLRFRMPAVREFRELIETGPLRLTINEYVNPVGITSGGLRWARLNGEMIVFRGEDGNLNFNPSQLRCSCGQFSAESTTYCPHIQGFQQAITERLTPQPRITADMTPEQRAAVRLERAQAAQAAFEAAAAADWTRNEETLAEARKTWREDSEVILSEDYDAYAAIREQVAANRAAKDGGIAIPYMKENALDGMATRESGQGFGMEIEYEFPPGMSYQAKREANQRIGEALYAANIFSTERQQGYHSAGRNGYKDVHVDPETGKGTWSFESDSTVNGGEIVSPLMYDEPATWENLNKVVEVLRANGAIPTKKAGAHVHVSTGYYESNAGKYTELARMMKQHEDVIMRLASDPNRGTHRGQRWAAAVQAVPENGFSDIAGLRTWQGGRYRVLNFGGVNTERSESGKDHPEFRLFDSTLDAGAMQSQIKLAVAMTHAAARNEAKGGTKRAAEPTGSHAARAKTYGRRMTVEQAKEDTATFRSLLDTLFKRKEDKEQMIHLFEHNKWNKG